MKKMTALLLTAMLLLGLAACGPRRDHCRSGDHRGSTRDHC